MSGLLLEDHEKRRFADWLRLQISTSEGMVEQFKKLKVPGALVSKEKNEQTACAIVLHMIESSESVTLASREQGGPNG